jgi:hypothetical protein
VNKEIVMLGYTFMNKIFNVFQDGVNAGLYKDIDPTIKKKFLNILPDN